MCCYLGRGLTVHPPAQHIAREGREGQVVVELLPPGWQGGGQEEGVHYSNRAPGGGLVTWGGGWRIEDEG